jgi:serine/threonine-protein kinase
MQDQVFLDRYRVVRLLDQGGMSNIYLARDSAISREVVIKVLKDPLRRNTRAVERLRHEIYILRQFRHPHVIAHLDSSPRHPQGPVLVLEYLRGSDLGQLLRREGRLSAERTGRLLLQLCQALQAAHDAGIVHRDIKPGNLMVLYPGTPHESIRLMDFGLAKMSALLYISEDELADYVAPTAMGTPEYLSPEQARGEESDARGDIYSTGVLLYEMLTGRRPFIHEDPARLLEAHAKAPPPAFDAILGEGHGVPSAVEAVVQWCLEKYPERRPASATLLAAEYAKGLGRVIATPGDVVIRRPPPPHLAAKSTDASAAQARPQSTAADRHAIRHCFEVTILEALAMLKVKGFIYDLGGKVIDNEPGRIRVQIGGATPQPQQRWGWTSTGQSAATTPQVATDLEVQLHRRDDAASPDALTITLVMRPPGGLVRPEWRTRCQQLARDLASYLMGR